MRIGIFFFFFLIIEVVINYSGGSDLEMKIVLIRLMVKGLCDILVITGFK